MSKAQRLSIPLRRGRLQNVEVESSQSEIEEMERDELGRMCRNQRGRDQCQADGGGCRQGGRQAHNISMVL